MLNIESTKIEFTDGNIGFMLIIEITKIINRRPYWNYANYREYQNRINRRHIGIMLIIEIDKIQFNGGHIGFMLIIDIAKIE